MIRRHDTAKGRLGALGIALTLTLNGLPQAGAQAPPAPLVPPARPARSVTLDEVVATALRNNTSVILAQERLRKSQEQIAQVDAQARPQVRVDVADTLSSNRTFATSGGSIINPSLPGGGQIPVIVDQGGGNSTGFVGGGGGGTTSSNGQTGTGSGSSTSTSGTGTSGLGTSSGGLGTGTTGTGLGTGTTGTGGNSGTGTTGTGAGTGTPGTGTNGTPGTGTTGNGNGLTGTAVGTRLVALAELPSVARDYAAQTQADSRLAPYTLRQPRDDLGGTTGTGGTGTGTGTVVTTTSATRGNYNNYSGRLSVTQYLDIFNLVGTARDVQNITRDFYLLDLQRVANETVLSAKNTYFNVLRYQDQVSVQQEQVNFATENLRIAQARFNAGAAAQFDVVTAQTNLSNAQNQLIQAQNTLELTQANLNNLLAVPQDAPLTLQTPPLPPLNQTPAPTQILQTAYANRPELRQADNNIVIAQKLIKLAGSSLKPTLGLVGSASYGGPSTVTSEGRHEAFSLSAVLGIPLSDGGTARSRVRSAQIDLETQNVTRSQLRANVELEVRQALSNVETAQARITATTQGVTQAQEAVRLAQVRYQNGIGTLLDVTNAQANLAQARTNLSGAQFDYQTALAQLTRAEGGR